MRTEDLITMNLWEHMHRRDKMIRLYQNYKGHRLDIENKTVSKASKSNNKLKNDYRGIIIDQIVGYLWGKPITYSLDNMNYEQHLFDKYHKELQIFLLRNNFDDLCSEAGKLASICGYSAFLNYSDENAKERVMILKPFETFFPKDRSDYAFRYYYVKREDNKGEIRDYRRIDFYDSKYITAYLELEDGNIILDPAEELNPKLHNFDYIPLVKIKNNDEELGDFEKVEELIDKYDYLLSMVQDEVDAFRLAYMVLYGGEIDEVTFANIKESGMFQGLDETMKLEFLTKQINDAFIENHKTTLNDNIYKFASAIDYNGQGFSGSAESGESRKWKLLPLENKAIVKERKFSTSLRNMFQVVASSWIKKGMNVDYLDIYFTFSRNIPVDLLYLSQVGTNLKGIVSEDTRLSALNGLVDDVEWEKEKMKEDMSGVTNLDSYMKEIIKGTDGEE